MRTEHRAALERLARAGISLSASLDTPGGCETAPLTVDQALAYIADRTAFAAQYFGLYLEDYRAWVKLGGMAQCCAMTKVGSRCCNPVCGAMPLSAHDWGAREDGFCGLHQP